MIIWDRGTYEPIGDLGEVLRTGRIAFVLHGSRLSGEFSVVRLRKGTKGNEWFLIKKRESRHPPFL